MGNKPKKSKDPSLKDKPEEPAIYVQGTFTPFAATFCIPYDRLNILVRPWDPPAFPGAPEFPESLTQLSFVQELDGSSKPQQMSYKGFYFVVKKSLTNEEQLMVSFL